MGYFEDRVELEDVPPVKKYKIGTFPEIIQMDYEKRQAIIEKNEAMLKDARDADRKLETVSFVLSEAMDMVDKIVKSINDLERAVSEPKLEIKLNFDSKGLTVEDVEKTITTVLQGYNNIMGD